MKKIQKNNQISQSLNSIRTSDSRYISNDQIFESNKNSHKIKISQKSILDENFYKAQSGHDVFNNNGLESNSNNSSKLSKESLRPAQVFINQFTKKWSNQKKLYLKIQKVFLIINFIMTLIMLALSVWVLVDEKFRIITSLANDILYSSFNRVIGFLSYILITLASLSLCVDISQTLSYIFTKKFLDSHKCKQIEQILNYQKSIIYLRDSLSDENEIKSLKVLVKIRRNFRTILINLKVLFLMEFVVILVLILGSCYFNAIFLHYNSKYIISYELPQSLIKVIREYEKQQIGLLMKQNQMVLKMENVVTNSTEEKLINRINTEFRCCNYQNPYQFGELTPPSCSSEKGCLKPMQEFMWDYLYTTVILLLFFGSFKFCVQLVLTGNFYIILIRRLINKLYSVNVRKLIDNEEDQSDKEEVRKKLLEIKRKKEEELQREEIEEQERLEREENQMFLVYELEKKQEEYERMLLEQKRFKELRFEQIQRRLQTHHLNEIEHDDHIED